ncbi:hypothetical protein PQX77_017274 [Marasmius sp. AFHP31]|nr:hypothetical protein PQX77_017274 [Marasmius sp. AFHP31]
MSFFQDAERVTINNGVFNLVAGNQTNRSVRRESLATLHSENEEFRLIPRGNIFLLRQVHESLHIASEVEEEGSSELRPMVYNQTMFHAQIVGSPGRFFVVKYSGTDAREVSRAFQLDLKLHLHQETWHQNILQLFARNTQIPALIFHDCIIPLSVFTRSCFKGSPFALWWLKCRLLIDFLTIKEFPFAGIKENLEVINRKGSEIEMTVGTVPNLWVQPQTGQLCVMPSSNRLEQPVCSWYVLRAGLDEEGLREVPPVPLEVYYKDAELSRRIDAETDLFSLLARTGHPATLPQDSVFGSSSTLQPGSVVFVSEPGISHVATVRLPKQQGL